MWSQLKKFMKDFYGRYLVKPIGVILVFTICAFLALGLIYVYKLLISLLW